MQTNTRRIVMHHAQEFWCDTHGIILPYVTMMLVVIVGVSLLALDGARYMSLQTQMQNGADALALAGAAELDRLPDAEVRATDAVNRLVTNSTLFGSDTSKNVRVSNIAFYSRLPESDARPISEGVLASAPTNARFVSVMVRPVTLKTIFPAGFFKGAVAVTTGASATAGLDQVVCQVTPIYVCNPHEAEGMAYDQATEALQRAAADPSIRRRLIRLRQSPNSHNQVGPGDYGFIDASFLGNGSTRLIDALAEVHPPVCFSQRGVTLRPGFVTNTAEAFNVRFDLYAGAMSGRSTDDNFRPSRNVRKGYVGSDENSCTAQPKPFSNWPIGSPPNQATGLPLDLTWPYMHDRMGDGRWDFSTYWQVNHGGADRPTINGKPADNANLPSRYDVYRYEIEHGSLADRSPGGESGAPTCYRGDVSSEVFDRRVVHAAILNCLSLGLSPPAENYAPVAAFAKFFLTLPLVSFQTDLYVELIGLMKPGDASNFDRVQLYR